MSWQSGPFVWGCFSSLGEALQLGPWKINDYLAANHPVALWGCSRLGSVIEFKRLLGERVSLQKPLLLQKKDNLVSLLFFKSMKDNTKSLTGLWVGASHCWLCNSSVPVAFICIVFAQVSIHWTTCWVFWLPLCSAEIRKKKVFTWLNGAWRRFYPLTIRCLPLHCTKKTLPSLQWYVMQC